jgi:signal-transduction protein with cAMP-binding, CBS, and nucleotidyltransferase domain
LNFNFSLDKEQLVLRKSKKEEEEVVAISKQDFIKRIPLFQGLTDAEYSQLANNIDTMTFKPGTNVIELDEQLACLYITEEGLLSVHVKAGDKMIKVAYLNTGSFFGEMSLLTGSKASATIIAENETTLYQVSKPIMKELFKNNPGLIKSISLIIAKRQAENSKRTAEIMSAEKLNAETKSIADRLVNSICNFFKL